MPNPNMEVYKGDSVNLAEIGELGGFNKVGEYIGRLNRMDPTTSAAGDPMLVAYFEVLEGKHEGEEIRFNFWLGARKDKITGRIFAPGVSEIKRSCAAIGKPLGDGDFKLDSQAAGRIFGQMFIQKRVRIKILPDQDRKDKEGNPVPGRWENGEWFGPTNPRILGLVTPVNLQSNGDDNRVNVPSAESPLKGIV